MKATTTPVLGIQPCEYDRSRTYGRNGENRLISAENGDTRLEFSYDYMGRRFEKKVYTANVLTKHEKFVYDGYKLIQVLDALNDNAVTMTFVWHPESTGLDTPFSMTYNGEIYYYVTDGNKNVTALLDADGNRAAEYIYHPFGTIYSKTGPMVDLNPFRFSSEYHDDETGLVYYNYRYYSPEFGRWISRDPIEEEGGVNLYAMVWNDSINLIDYNGLADNRRNIIKITVRAFYPGDSKVPQTRPDGSGDISAFGGFWVDATPKKCCCPEGGSKKDVVLMQLLKDGDNWRVDAYREDLQEGRLTNRNGVNRHQAYRDDEYDIHGKKTHSGGRGMNGSSVGYSDAPGLSRHPMTGEYELAGSYFREFRVEAFCRCAASDVYTGNSVDFSVTRPAKSPTILFAIRDVNCNGDPAANPSRYPARR